MVFLFFFNKARENFNLAKIFLNVRVPLLNDYSGEYQQMIAELIDNCRT